MSEETDGLKVEGLSFSAQGRDIVSGISLDVRSGQVTCLLGPSGCGKSTTLRIIAGVTQQDAGRVSLDGRLLSDGRLHLPPEERRIGLIFQDFALFPHFNVAQNVGFGLSDPKAERAARVAETLERVHLTDFADAFPHELSGGEQQRVALARSIAPKPRVMLMDEPFSGLDNRLRDGIRDETLDILKEEGTAVILVTHEPEEAMRMADEIALMRNGQIVQQGAPYTLYNAPVDRMAAAFFSDINAIQGKVESGVVKTPFGEIAAPGLPNGGEVDVIIRPQHVGIDFDRNGRGPNPTAEDGVPVRGIVRRARFMGYESLVEFQMDYDGSMLKATVPSVFLPKPGKVLWITLRRKRCMVLAAGDA
ncbi:MAG: ABC transporter ATP-binding protein [Pseudomonadota bacterium]